MGGLDTHCCGEGMVGETPFIGVSFQSVEGGELG